jgi:hypothetical protein
MAIPQSLFEFKEMDIFGPSRKAITAPTKNTITGDLIELVFSSRGYREET